MPKHFFCFQKMTDIGSAVTTASRTADSLLQSAWSSSSYLALNRFSFTMIGIHMSMTSIPAGIYTVKEIHTPFHRFQNICRCSNAHKVSRFILPEDTALLHPESGTSLHGSLPLPVLRLHIRPDPFRQFLWHARYGYLRK